MWSPAPIVSSISQVSRRRLAASTSISDPQAFGYTRREPLGVVAGIGAWNYPLQIACWKAAPALACGNAMIFKPAELTPLTAVKLEEIFSRPDCRPACSRWCRVLPRHGRLLTRHPGIRKVSLTGEVGTGKAVMSDAAQTLKSVTLELGGKSPLIVFDDAKLDNAVSGALLGNFYSSGQVCSNATRVFVHCDDQGRISRASGEARRARCASAIRWIPRPRSGRWYRNSTCKRCSATSRAAAPRAHGSLIGGNRVTSGNLAKGYFVAPTVFDECRDDMAIVREEIFGPVMSVLEFEDEARSHRARQCHRVRPRRRRVHQRFDPRRTASSRGLQAGTCWINHYNITPIELPFGGVKMSGLGRENGRAATRALHPAEERLRRHGRRGLPVLTTAPATGAG